MIGFCHDYDALCDAATIVFYINETTNYGWAGFTRGVAVWGAFRKKSKQRPLLILQ